MGYVSRSEDGGDNWIRIGPGGEDPFIKKVLDIAVDNHQQVFAATTSGLFKWEGNEIADWKKLEITNLYIYDEENFFRLCKEHDCIPTEHSSTKAIDIFNDFVDVLVFHCIFIKI